MKVRYLIKKKGEKGGLNPIYVALYLNDETELIYTKQRCSLKDWSVEDRCPKDHKGVTFLAIEKVKRDVQKVIQSLQSQDKPVTPFTVKLEYNAKEKEKTQTQHEQDNKDKAGLKTVSRLAEKWLENNLFGYKASTQKAIRESIKQFIEYLRKTGQLTLERKDLVTDIITGYERYLQEKKKLSNSTHGKRMKHLRWFLKTLNYDVKTIAIRSHKKEIIALTLDELQNLEKVDVSASIEQQKSKDMFLLGCYTGLRISDLKRINETRIIEGKICMTLQKNKKEVSIPLRSETKEILKKYGMASPKISEQQLNESIKKICKAAGIDKDLTVKTNKAGKDIETIVKKHQLITSHTASKTFITLAPQRFGLTPPEIAAIVGKDLKTLINHYFQLPLESAIMKMIKE